MCTLTYIPQEDGFVFTHNRDENHLREPAIPLAKHIINGIEIAFPQDGRAGGTWIAADVHWSVCLLNGAFNKHNHQPPYRKSRGLMLLDFFAFADVARFCSEYDFENIEPFTLVCAHNQSFQLEEIRWDGEKIHHRGLSPAPRIWSSVTLYDETARTQREALFLHYLKTHKSPDPKSIMHFHHTGETGSIGENLMMQRPNGVQTLSISQITVARFVHFKYKDIILNAETNLKIEYPLGI